jgi:hypothetical protein
MSKFRTSELTVGVVKVDYLDFPCEIFEILCEFDDRVIACNF